MSSNYAAGAAFERKIKKVWENLGYEVVRSAGSHGPFDLVALPTSKRDTKIIAIQCKRCDTRTTAIRLKKEFFASHPCKAAENVVVCFTAYIIDEQTTEEYWS